MNQTQQEIHDLLAPFFQSRGWPAETDSIVVSLARYVEEKVAKATAPNATSAK